MKIFWAQTFSTRSLPGDLRVFRAFASLFQRKLENLEELENEADLVVNCCGLGAADLVDDKDMVPIAGHVLRVEAPWVGSVLIDSRDDSWAYLIPNRDSLVMSK